MHCHAGDDHGMQILYGLWDILGYILFTTQIFQLLCSKLKIVAVSMQKFRVQTWLGPRDFVKLYRTF